MENSFDNIPTILKQQNQWVVWGLAGKPPKAPFNPASLLSRKTVPAKSGVPETWDTFAAAAECVAQSLAQGVGYEFAGDGIYGVDLDHVLDDHGVITPRAREIVEQLNSYTEISPSGHGLHIFVTASNVDIARHHKQGGFVEIYNAARYFTVTGNIYNGLDRMADRPAELQQIHDRFLLPNLARITNHIFSVESPNEDQFLWRGLEKDMILRACWNGEQRRGDESASDQALMNKLAYWCNANPESMIAAFLESPYFASKDEAHKRKCQRADYLPGTAKNACATLRSTAKMDTERHRSSRCMER